MISSSTLAPCTVAGLSAALGLAAGAAELDCDELDCDELDVDELADELPVEPVDSPLSPPHATAKIATIAISTWILRPLMIFVRLRMVLLGPRKLRLPLSRYPAKSEWSIEISAD